MGGLVLGLVWGFGCRFGFMQRMSHFSRSFVGETGYFRAGRMAAELR